MKAGVLIISACAVVCFLAVAFLSNEDALPEAKSEVTTSADREWMLSSEFLEIQAASTTLTNIIALKSFCIAARPRMMQLLLSSSNRKYSTLADFVLVFGKDMPASSKPSFNVGFGTLKTTTPTPSTKNNIIMQYSQAMGRLKTQYTKGMGRYILSHLDKSVIAGKGPLMIYKDTTGKATGFGSPRTVVTFNHKAVGFRQHAKYLLKLSVEFSKFSTSQYAVAKVSQNAATQASAVWLRTGQNEHYKDFIGNTIAKYKRLEKQHGQKVFRAALAGARRAFQNNTQIVHTMAPGARNSAHAADSKSPFKFPSTKQLKSEAKENTAKWYKKMKKMKAKSLIKKLEEQAKAKVAAAAAKAAAAKAKAAAKKAAAAKAKAVAKAKAAAVKAAIDKVKAASGLVNQFAGVYHVYYRGKKRDTDMTIACDGQVEQKSIFKDRLHFSKVKAKCSQKRDAKATMYILKTHGEAKYECVHKHGTTIKGSHYVGPNRFWGTVEYRLKTKASCTTPQSTRKAVKACQNARDFTLHRTGGQCYFDKKRRDCAQCRKGGCQCWEKSARGHHACVKCGKGAHCQCPSTAASKASATTNAAHGGNGGGSASATTNAAHGGNSVGSASATTNAAHGGNGGGSASATTNAAHGGNSGGSASATTNAGSGIHGNGGSPSAAANAAAETAALLTTKLATAEASLKRLRCEKDTGGTCAFMKCFSERKAQCISTKCMCPAGWCSTKNGVCVKDSPIAAKARANAEGEVRRLKGLLAKVTLPKVPEVEFMEGFDDNYA